MLWALGGPWDWLRWLVMTLGVYWPWRWLMGGAEFATSATMGIGTDGFATSVLLTLLRYWLGWYQLLGWVGGLVLPLVTALWAGWRYARRQSWYWPTATALVIMAVFVLWVLPITAEYVRIESDNKPRRVAHTRRCFGIPETPEFQALCDQTRRFIETPLGTAMGNVMGSSAAWVNAIFDSTLVWIAALGLGAFYGTQRAVQSLANRQRALHLARGRRKAEAEAPSADTADAREPREETGEETKKRGWIAGSWARLRSLTRRRGW